MTQPQIATIRRFERIDDDGFRATLYAEVNAVLFASLPAELREPILRQQLAAQAAGCRARYPEARYEIVEVNDVPIGRIVTAQTAEAIRIADIAILAAWRGRGIGTALLREAIAEAQASRRRVRLTVAASNNAAQRLYKRLGFEPIWSDALDVMMEWRS